MSEDRFRFRVWKTYSDGDIFALSGRVDGLFLAPNGQVFSGYHDYYNGLEMEEQEPEKIIIEQCTGLKDKNGKLIYEGDVLKFSREHEAFRGKKKYAHYPVAEVFWDSGDPGTCASGFALRGNVIGGSKDTWMCMEKEIIGNIHENPDLLK